jgi:Na+/H+ antiporter NhaA
VPVFAAVGGMVAPAGLFLLSAYAIGDMEVVRGWAIPR